jgi:hypothetical protein
MRDEGGVDKGKRNEGGEMRAKDWRRSNEDKF